MKKSSSVNEIDSSEELSVLEKIGIGVDKVVSVLVILFAILIIVLLFYLHLLIENSENLNKEVEYNYDCESIDAQIENTNNKTLHYYKYSIEDLYDNILISPLCVQSSIYDYYNKEDIQKPEMFKYFGNGYKTWNESGNIFNYDCFSTFFPGEIDSKETLIGKASDESDGFLKILGIDEEYSIDSLYSVFHLSYGIKDAIYCSKDDLIEYDGRIGYKKAEDYNAIKLPLSNSKYSVYFIEGNIQSFNTSDFLNKNALVEISPYTWQSYGKISNLASSFEYVDSDVIMLTQFGFSEHNHDVVETSDKTNENVYFFVADYSVIITDEETGLILAVGKHK